MPSCFRNLVNAKLFMRFSMNPKCHLRIHAVIFAYAMTLLSADVWAWQHLSPDGSFDAKKRANGTDDKKWKISVWNIFQNGQLVGTIPSNGAVPTREDIMNALNPNK